jgi:transcriptional regulator with XRE-family HTH domain
MTTLEKIQAYCRQRGMSQAAIDLGVKRSQVNAWLEGSKKPSLDVVDKFIALGWEPGAELKAQSAASAEAAPVASSCGSPNL